MVTILRTVTNPLHPFLPYIILALKNSYRTGIWLSKIIPGREFSIETYLDERQPLMEDRGWKTTFNGRQTLMEDDLRWKMTFTGRRLLMEDDLRWKTTFNGRRHSMEDDLSQNIFKNKKILKIFMY